MENGVYWFESLVNTEGIQTILHHSMLHHLFESLVNTEGIQTQMNGKDAQRMFESLVNTEGIQTCSSSASIRSSLRVLLIRKEFKLEIVKG